MFEIQLTAEPKHAGLCTLVFTDASSILNALFLAHCGLCEKNLNGFLNIVHLEKSG
jgi:hypothetical protein